METLSEIQVQPTLTSRLKNVDWNHLEFGKYVSDHMFLSTYKKGDWLEPQVIPFQNLSLAPTTLALHYGQSVFEGMKAFRMQDGGINIFRIEKIHITPDEAGHWGIRGGDTLKVYETDSGKVGILICYDVEFPELPRLLAEQGMQILFVPFLTDTQNAYMRVRCCAQARAIENECYVAITGSVGNLPKVENMDIQYSQSAVFTPCDFAFPSNGVKSEASPNT